VILALLEADSVRRVLRVHDLTEARGEAVAWIDGHPERSATAYIDSQTARVYVPGSRGSVTQRTVEKHNDSGDV